MLGVMLNVSPASYVAEVTDVETCLHGLQVSRHCVHSALFLSEGHDETASVCCYIICS